MVELLLANLFVAVAAFVQAAVGIGFAMIAVPLLVLIDLNYAPGPSLMIMLALSLIMLASSWRDVLRRGLKSLFPGLIFGTAVGALMLGQLSPATFGVVFGIIVLIGVGLSLLRNLPKLTPTHYGIGGFFAGMMGTLSGIHGPPLVVLYQRATPAQARATIALIFSIATVLSLAGLFLQGQVNAGQFSTALKLVPGLVLGLVLAIYCRQLMSRSLARNLMLVLAATSAVTLIIKSIL